MYVATYLTILKQQQAQANCCLAMDSRPQEKEKGRRKTKEYCGRLGVYLPSLLNAVNFSMQFQRNHINFNEYQMFVDTYLLSGNN